MLFKIINPHDSYTLKADDPRVAMVAVLIIGEGKYGLDDEKGESYPTLCMCLTDQELTELITRTFGKGGLATFVENNKETVADCLDSVMSVNFSERRLYEEALAFMDSDEKREAYRAKVHDMMRSSSVDLGTYAWKRAKALRERVVEVNYYIPNDLVDTKDYLVGRGVLCSHQWLVKDVEEAVKGLTMGEAMEKLEEPELYEKVRVTIQMPEPRQPPWRILPVILVEDR